MKKIAMALAVGVLASAAHAQPLELLSVQGSEDFEKAAQTLPPSWVPWQEKLLGIHPRPATFVEKRAVRSSDQPIAVLDIAPMFNQHWRTSLTFPLGGQTTFISSGFDRNQSDKAFLSVYIEGWPEPKFFEMHGLTHQPGYVQTGPAKYAVSVSADIFHPKQSKINFKNVANDRERYRATLQNLIDAIYGAGRLINLADSEYRIFYSNDVRETSEGPVLNPAIRTFSFLVYENGDLYPFWIPVESVPADGIAVFKLYRGQKVGLQAVDHFLRIYQR